MSGVGEAIGAAAGVSSLFSAALTCFDYVYIAKNAIEQTDSLMLKLDNAQLRLSRWGKSVGLSSGTCRLTEEQTEHAKKVLSLITTQFDKCALICHKDRDERGVNAEEYELEPYGPQWANEATKYLHNKMLNLADLRKPKRSRRERETGMSVGQRVKFAIYKKSRLEELIKDINEQINNLLEVCPMEKEEQEDHGKEELHMFMEIFRELRNASDHDTLLKSAVNNIMNQQAQALSVAAENVTTGVIGQMSGGSTTVTSNIGERRRQQ